jgi:hypothetical protein
MTVQAFAVTSFAALTMQYLHYGPDTVGGGTNAILGHGVTLVSLCFYSSYGDAANVGSYMYVHL